MAAASIPAAASIRHRYRSIRHCRRSINRLLLNPPPSPLDPALGGEGGVGERQHHREGEAQGERRCRGRDRRRERRR
uniref:Uncharacterized protein n=1 Tax=Oryza barthii TaxID=65489 RepID=A0A0D3ETL6_9ORYZ